MLPVRGCDYQGASAVLPGRGCDCRLRASAAYRPQRCRAHRRGQPPPPLAPAGFNGAAYGPHGTSVAPGQARTERWQGRRSCVSFSPCLGRGLRLAMHDAHPGRLCVDNEAVSFVPRFKPRADGSMGRKGVWGGREPRADGSLGRKGVWGGWEYGAEGSMWRMGAWGGREPGAEGSLGRMGAWGGWEYGAEGSMGRKGVWGARHIPTHHPPLAPSSYDISQPAGRHLPYSEKCTTLVYFTASPPLFSRGPQFVTLPNKVDASRRAEKCRSLRVQVEDGVSGCA